MKGTEGEDLLLTYVRAMDIHVTQEITMTYWNPSEEEMDAAGICGYDYDLESDPAFDLELEQFMEEVAHDAYLVDTYGIAIGTPAKHPMIRDLAAHAAEQCQACFPF